MARSESPRKSRKSKYECASYLILSEEQARIVCLVAESSGYVLQDPPVPFEAGGMMVNAVDLGELSDRVPGLVERLRLPVGAL